MRIHGDDVIEWRRRRSSTADCSDRRFMLIVMTDGCGGGEKKVVDVVFDGAFGGVRDEEVVVGEGVVVISSSLDMLTNSCLGGIMLSLIFLEGLVEEALVEFMVE
ncbi:hypothetical protein Tco_0421460 [Tanacetum coccineum]